MDNTNRLRAGIKVRLIVDFGIVKETLERIGIIRHDLKTVYPSCYCISARLYGIDGDAEDEYYIVHFKELFRLDNRESSFSDMDELRLNTIAFLLHKWGLVECLSPVKKILAEPIDVLPYNKKVEYNISHKYRFTRTVDLGA